MKNFLCFIFILISLNHFGQYKSLKKDSVSYDRIIKINQEIDDLYNTSSQTDLKNIEEYIATLNNKNLENYNYFLSTFPHSEYTFSALHGKASTEHALKNYEDAKKSFIKTLKYINDNKGKTDNNYFITFGKDDERLLNDIYTRLANIEMAQKNYLQALQYLDEAQKNSYSIWCANGLFPEIAKVANLYSECYFNLGDDEKICDILIPVSAIPMIDENSPTITRLYETLSKKYEKEELKSLFKNSFETLYSKEGIINNKKMTVYYVKFLNRDVILYDSYKNLSSKKIKEKLKKNLRFSKFYALLSK